MASHATAKILLIIKMYSNLLSNVTVGRSDSFSCGLSNDRTGSTFSDLSHLRSCTWSAKCEKGIYGVGLRAQVTHAILNTKPDKSAYRAALPWESQKLARFQKWYLLANPSKYTGHYGSHQAMRFASRMHQCNCWLISVFEHTHKSLGNLRGRSGGVCSSSSVSTAAEDSDEKNFGRMPAAQAIADGLCGTLPSFLKQVIGAIRALVELRNNMWNFRWLWFSNCLATGGTRHRRPSRTAIRSNASPKIWNSAIENTN